MHFSMSELEACLPEGTKLKDVVFEIEKGYDSDYATVKAGINSHKQLENYNYNRLLKEYKKATAKYLSGKEGYRQECKDWAAWVDQEKQIEVARQLKHAEKFIKKHKKP